MKDKLNLDHLEYQIQMQPSDPDLIEAYLQLAFRKDLIPEDIKLVPLLKILIQNNRWPDFELPLTEYCKTHLQSKVVEILERRDISFKDKLKFKPLFQDRVLSIKTLYRSTPIKDILDAYSQISEFEILQDEDIQQILNTCICTTRKYIKDSEEFRIFLNLERLLFEKGGLPQIPDIASFFRSHSWCPDLVLELYMKVCGLGISFPENVEKALWLGLMKSISIKDVDISKDNIKIKKEYKDASLEGQFISDPNMHCIFFHCKFNSENSYLLKKVAEMLPGVKHTKFNQVWIEEVFSFNQDSRNKILSYIRQTKSILDYLDEHFK
jgi:hypothetical protein